MQYLNIFVDYSIYFLNKNNILFKLKNKIYKKGKFCFPPKHDS